MARSTVWYALCVADRTRLRFDLDELDDVEVTIARLHYQAVPLAELIAGAGGGH